jgi:23S rRNA (adenine2503-C2)-methyltransferase
MKKNIKQLSLDELHHLIAGIGEKPYRAKQIQNWVYGKSAPTFDDMTDLSISLRDKLRKIAFISNLRLANKVVSRDNTKKFLFELEDGEKIESVLIPNTKGQDKFTLCISSQAGCSLRCRFCMTGTVGFRRNLKAYEIFDQVISVKRLLSSHEENLITNIVFMGMGEPMNNLNAVIRALEVITGPLGFSKRKVTVSTAGIPRGIARLAHEGPDVNLAISLSATTDEIRSRIMPVNKKYPIAQLMKSCREYPLSPRRRITFEYILIDGLNDSPEDAMRLKNLLKGIKSKVNLIPFNDSSLSIIQQVKNLPVLKKPSEKKVFAFQKRLTDLGIATSVRISRGSDISAACGQLRADYSIKSR